MLRFVTSGPLLRRIVALAALLGAFDPVALHALPAATVKPVEARVWSCIFPSAALGREMCFNVVLPSAARETAPVPVIYFLHGRGRDERTLLADDFCRRALFASPCAIVLPRGLDGWYVDSPVVPEDKFASYLDEVIAVAEANFPLRRDATGRAITGWSMGGYGAAYTFFRRPEDFAALATIIGIIDYPRAPIESPELNYPVQPRFGSDPAVWQKLNPRLQLAQAKPRPLLIAYADRAPERQMNAVFLENARTLGWPVRELRIPGEHVFSVVREAVPPVLSFLELQLLPPAAISPPNPPR